MQSRYNLIIALSGFKSKMHQYAPITCMTKKVAQFLGAIIGDVEGIDVGESGNGLSAFIRG